MTWLSKTPQAVVKCHVEMMERLSAEEALEGTAVAGVGRGLEPGEWGQRQLSRWQRAADRSQRNVTAATPAVLASMGIGLRIQEAAPGV